MNEQDFIPVNLDEYNTVFDFYVNQLGLEYVSGDLRKINTYLNLANEQDLKIVEKLKCGKAYVIYIWYIKKWEHYTLGFSSQNRLDYSEMVITE